MADKKNLASQIVHIVPLMMRSVRADLRCEGVAVAPAHFRLLGILASKNQNLSELAENQAVTSATMSNSVAILVERGWVERIPDAHDRRMVQIGITPAGRHILNAVHQQLHQRVADMLLSVPENDLEALQNGMQVLTRMLEQADWKAPMIICEEPLNGFIDGAHTHPAVDNHKGI
jgi:DNA-binding MarR family transcriptional regulator